MASAMICFRAMPDSLASLRQSSYSGAIVALAGDLDADRAVRRLDFGEAARLHAPLGGVDAQAQRGRFGEDQLRQAFALLGPGDDAQQAAGAALSS